MDSRIKELSPIAEVISVRANDPEGNPQVDKNGNHFVTLRIQGLTETERIIGGKRYTVKGRGKQVSLNQWEESYLPSKNGNPDDFFNSQPGDMLAVGIYRAETEPYPITDEETGEIREVTSRTFPVVEGDNPATILKNDGYDLADVAHSDESTEVKEGTMGEVAEEAAGIAQ